MIDSKNLMTNGSVVPLTVDGVHKTISAPVTGRALHTVAGMPPQLVTVGGKTIEINDDLVEFEGEKLELITKHDMSGSEVVNPEHLLGGSKPAAVPEHSQTLSHTIETTDGKVLGPSGEELK